ncbi:thiolase domain-containing protein [Candidatus Daviesbacteria bacterium]|nr:thiolase domain-containing protein [Candidatus Daviesbacteria bacterium]
MKIGIAGVGITKFGELWGKSLEDLIIDAANQALIDSKLDKSKIDALFIGNMLYGKLSNQDHLGAFAASLLGINVPAFRIEAACASGGLAVHLAIQSILAGSYENVLVIGAEKMTDYPSSEISLGLMGAGSEEERHAGLTFPGLYALMAKAHIQKYGTTKEQLAATAVKNHYHASLNSNAQYPFEISIEKVLKSGSIVEPLTLLDSSPITDGAAAIILSKSVKPDQVYIAASAVSSDNLNLSSRETLTELKATQIAAKKAYTQAKVSPSDIDLAEVHDCFTIAEILAMEDLGFCKKGQGGKFIEQGTTRLGGKLPVNTSGGLKACGHPVGATGVKQILEIAQQLKGLSGKRQVKKASVGLTQNVGGTGATSVVHILKI